MRRSPASAPLPFLAPLLLALLPLAGCGEGGSGDAPTRPRLAFVTNGVDPFWDLAVAGARAAGTEYGVEVLDYCPPNNSVDEQQQKLEDLLTRGVDGVAISPIDATHMVGLLDEVAARVPLITHDSDAPGSTRRCFVGCDNYAAGRAVGQLVKEALPEGGDVMLFIGRLEQDNAQLRRQGVIDELLDRPSDPTRRDPVDGVLEGAGFRVLGTVVDNFAPSEALAKAEDALTRHAGLDCMVGLFAYNPPACLEAIRKQDKLGQVRVVGFDEHRATLEAIRDGHVVGTVSQNPYAYGHESIRVLEALVRGDSSVLPEDGVLHVQHGVYRQDNVGEILELLDRVLDGGR